jgi:hypothetical protein
VRNTLGASPSVKYLIGKIPVKRERFLLVRTPGQKYFRKGDDRKKDVTLQISLEGIIW